MNGDVWIVSGLDAKLEKVVWKRFAVGFFEPLGLRIVKDEIAITFPEPLATAEANDAANFAIEQYNYQWWSTYGSPDLSLAKPGEKGRDKVEVKAAKLSADGKTVTLAIPGLKPVMQMEIKLQLRGADGAEIRTMIGNTINKVP